MLDLNNISLKNKKTWSLIQKGHTSGVFQLESELGKQWVSKIKPRNINELSATLALIRPACLESGMTDQYSKIKNSQEPPLVFNDNDVDKILSPTHGVLIYQEQLMKFGGDIAWKHLPHLERLVAVDKLRKGIGKKKASIINDLKKRFVDGCKKNGKTEALALKLFEMIEYAGRYAFNDAHAKKYALISYKTAYLKANFPYEFYSVYLTYSRSKQKQKEEIRSFVNEARMLGLRVLPPCIKSSEVEFGIELLEDNKSIRFGLSHIKQVSIKDSELIVSNRKSVMEFGKMLELHFVGSKGGAKLRGPAIESLINSGACDLYNLSRCVMYEIFTILKSLTLREIEYVFEYLKRTGEYSGHNIKKAISECSKNQSVKKRKDLVLSESESINLTQKDVNSLLVSKERDILGIEFSKTIITENSKSNFTCKQCFAQSKQNQNVQKVLVAKITEIINLVTKKGKTPGSEMCQIVATDNTGSFRIVCFPNEYKKLKHSMNINDQYRMTIKGTGSGWSLVNLKISK
jgi:DNA polymerase III alpha subunit